MKSKLVILSFLLLGSAVTATAQDKEKYYSESFKDNIFVSAGIGGHMAINDGTHKISFPMASVSLGKFFNPVWGIRLQGAGYWSTKATTNYFGFDESLKKKYLGLHADALFNLTNLFAGYKPGRMFELLGFIGPSMHISNYHSGLSISSSDGVITEIQPKGDDKFHFLPGASIGLAAKFNVNEFWAIDVEARGAMSSTVFGPKSGFNTDGYVGATIGATYTFGGKKFAPVSGKVDQNALNNEINKYRSALAEAESELAATKNALANVKPTEKVVTETVEVAGPRAIFFQIGKSNIDDYGMVNIQLAAKIIKANPNKKYKVAGYADKGTGSSSWNQKLSEKRAQAVYDALIKEGVDSSQIELVGFGGTANMFGQNKLNRVVILE